MSKKKADTNVVKSIATLGEYCELILKGEKIDNVFIEYKNSLEQVTNVRGKSQAVKVDIGEDASIFVDTYLVTLEVAGDKRLKGDIRLVKEDKKVKEEVEKADETICHVMTLLDWAKSDQSKNQSFVQVSGEDKWHILASAKLLSDQTYQCKLDDREVRFRGSKQVTVKSNKKVTAATATATAEAITATATATAAAKTAAAEKAKTDNGFVTLRSQCLIALTPQEKQQLAIDLLNSVNMITFSAAAAAPAAPATAKPAAPAPAAPAPAPAPAAPAPAPAPAATTTTATAVKPAKSVSTGKPERLPGITYKEILKDDVNFYLPLLQRINNLKKDKSSYEVSQLLNTEGYSVGSATIDEENRTYRWIVGISKNKTNYSSLISQWKAKNTSFAKINSAVKKFGSHPSLAFEVATNAKTIEVATNEFAVWKSKQA
jgi:hypothetical protein